MRYMLYISFIIIYKIKNKGGRSEGGRSCLEGAAVTRFVDGNLGQGKCRLTLLAKIKGLESGLYILRNIF